MFVAALDIDNPGMVNYSLVTGDNINSAVTFYQTDGVTPIDLTGYTAKMGIGFSNSVELTTENGGLVISAPTTGVVIIKQSSTNTAAWAPGVYNYDFWLIATTSPINENEFFSGTITINPSVSPVP